MSDQSKELPAIVEYRALQAQRRAAAFCDVHEHIVGTRVLPVTPATYSMLYALGSAFLFDSRKATFTDVLQYIWLHSPHYSHTGVPFWRVRRWFALRKILFEFNQPWRKTPDENRRGAVMQIAVSEIKRLLDEAFADAPSGTARPGPPVASLEASFIHEFATSYNWAPEKTRHWPLRQLMQIHRCIRTARGEEIRDHGEDQITYRHLKAFNEHLALKRMGAARG